MNRWRLFGLLAVLFLILHVIANLAAVIAFKTDASISDRFGASFALALTSLPLMRLTFFNSVIVAVVIAAVIAFLPARASVAILAGVPILLLAGMLGATAILDWNTDRGWRELAVRPITPAPQGTLAIASMGSTSAIGDYVNKATRTDAAIALPQEADWFLVLHRREIDALRHELPNAASFIDRFVFQRLLLADAMQTRATDEIDAAKRIADTLLHDPNVGAANLAIASARQRIAVARKLGMSQPIGFDPHHQLIDAIHAQVQAMRALKSPWYARPYARLCIAESAYAAMQQARVIRNLRGVRFDQPKDEQPAPRVPWNPIGVFAGGRRMAWRANELVSLAAPTSK